MLYLLNYRTAVHVVQLIKTYCPKQTDKLNNKHRGKSAFEGGLNKKKHSHKPVNLPTTK